MVLQVRIFIRKYVIDEFILGHLPPYFLYHLICDTRDPLPLTSGTGSLKESFTITGGPVIYHNIRIFHKPCMNNYIIILCNFHLIRHYIQYLIESCR